MFAVCKLVVVTGWFQAFIHILHAVCFVLFYGYRYEIKFLFVLFVVCIIHVVDFALPHYCTLHCIHIHQSMSFIA